MNKILGALFGLLAAISLNAQSGYKPGPVFHIASPGGWDYPCIDPASGKLYLSHGNQVNVLNARTGDSVGVITGTQGVHGVAIDNKLNKGYTSNGRLNSVSVFNLSTGEVIRQIAVGKNPDWIMYDAFSDCIITSNHSGGDISLIDPSKDEVLSTIAVDGAKLETIVADGGKLFINAEDKNEIDVVDLKEGKLIAHCALGAEGPTGLAYDRKTKRLFATCDKELVVVDAENMKVVTKVPIGDGADGAAFDDDHKLIFTSNGEGTITVVKEISKNEYKVVETIKTKRGARTITIDQTTHTLYLPTVDYEPVAAGSPANTRPRVVPGSFQVLTYSYMP